MMLCISVVRLMGAGSQARLRCVVSATYRRHNQDREEDYFVSLTNRPFVSVQSIHYTGNMTGMETHKERLETYLAYIDVVPVL